jgi:hypothetical protein
MAESLDTTNLLPNIREENTRVVKGANTRAPRASTNIRATSTKNSR